MKKSYNLVTRLAITTLLTIGGTVFVQETQPSVINQLNGQSTTVKAATTTSSITLPNGYTAKRILAVNNDKISKKDKAALVNASIEGMKGNVFQGDEREKSEIVDTTNLTYSQKLEINRYALSLINSVREQMNKDPWILNKSAMKFADRVAVEHYNNNKSVWDADHYTAGITRAAVKSGLENAGQVYEDETGLPITSQFNGSTRSMYALKQQIHFNVKQMLFGGYYGRMSDFDNSKNYTEWEHAGDLLGLRSAKGYDAKMKYFGLNFSGLKNDPSKISVHFIGVAPRYIKNYQKFNIYNNIY